MMDKLLFPTLLAAVVIIVSIAAIKLHDSRRAGFLRESSIVLTAYFIYFLIRGATEGRADEAIARAASLESLEGRLGLLFEVDLQAAIIDQSWLIEAANAVYIWGHWPLIGAIGLWLYVRRHDRYRKYRNTMLVSGAIGVVMFALFPTAPPRLANPEIVDTIVTRSDLYRVMQPALLTNQYAAVPSLHFGWNLLMGLALVREARFPLARLVGWLSPPLMLLATLITGNHYILDIVAGGAIVLVVLAVIDRESLRIPAWFSGSDTAQLAEEEVPIDR